MSTHRADSFPCRTQEIRRATEPNSRASCPEFGTAQYVKSSARHPIE